MFRDVHLIGWPLLTNDLTNTRDCGVNWGGFPLGRRESLLSTDQNRTVRHVLAAKNPGNDFLYFGFAQNGGSLFVGAPGTDAATLRNAIYRFVNKVNYRDIEPNSAGSHSVVNRLDTPWAPVNCPPWTPCALTVDAGFVGTGTAKQTDSGPGTLALTMGGLLDRDGDGIRETSASVPISFRILAPSFTLDPRKTTISGDMEFLLRGAGLDVTTSVYDSWTALNNAIAGCTDSCMYIQRYRSATTLPDWLMGMPEIRAANDPQVDLHLNLGGGSSFSQGTRALHTGHVFHLLSVGADVLPVLHFDSLEAFDFESFEGWVPIYGGINNFWSLTGLRLPDLGPLSVRLSIFPTRTLGPGGTTDVQVEVRDGNGIPVAGVDVALSAGMGTLTAPAGTTDGSGIFRTEYTAPATIAEDADVMVDAVVMKDQYQGAMASEPLTLHEPAPAELRVTVVRGAPEIDSGNTTTITVEVLDASGAPVSGAAVALRTDLPGATISPASGTTGATGEFQATFTADVRQEMRYQVVADVSMAGYADDLGSASLVVRPEVVDVPRIDVPRNVPGFEAASAVGAVAVVFVLVALARRRRED
jgi:hypothetical protein